MREETVFVTDPEKQFKINLNLWGLVVGLGGLEAAEYLRLCALFWFSLAVLVLIGPAVAVTTFAYTRDYWKERHR